MINAGQEDRKEDNMTHKEEEVGITDTEGLHNNNEDDNKNVEAGNIREEAEQEGGALNNTASSRQDGGMEEAHGKIQEAKEGDKGEGEGGGGESDSGGREQHDEGEQPNRGGHRSDGGHQPDSDQGQEGDHKDNSEEPARRGDEDGDQHHQQQPQGGARSDPGVPPPDPTEPDDSEWSQLRCGSQCTEEIAQKQKQKEERRSKREAASGGGKAGRPDYPGFAFGSAMFSSDATMKFNIIKNELHNIMKSQLKRVDGEVNAFANRIKEFDKKLEESEKYVRLATAALADAVALQIEESKNQSEEEEKESNLSAFDQHVLFLEAQLTEARFKAAQSIEILEDCNQAQINLLERVDPRDIEKSKTLGDSLVSKLEKDVSTASATGTASVIGGTSSATSDTLPGDSQERTRVPPSGHNTDLASENVKLDHDIDEPGNPGRVEDESVTVQTPAAVTDSRTSEQRSSESRSLDSESRSSEGRNSESRSSKSSRRSSRLSPGTPKSRRRSPASSDSSFSNLNESRSSPESSRLSPASDQSYHHTGRQAPHHRQTNSGHKQGSSSHRNSGVFNSSNRNSGEFYSAASRMSGGSGTPPRGSQSGSRGSGDGLAPPRSAGGVTRYSPRDRARGLIPPPSLNPETQQAIKPDNSRESKGLRKLRSPKASSLLLHGVISSPGNTDKTNSQHNNINNNNNINNDNITMDSNRNDLTGGRGINNNGELADRNANIT